MSNKVSRTIISFSEDVNGKQTNKQSGIILIIEISDFHADNSNGVVYFAIFTGGLVR